MTARQMLTRGHPVDSELVVKSARYALYFLAFLRLRFFGAAAFALRFFALFAIFASFQISVRRGCGAR